MKAKLCLLLIMIYDLLTSEVSFDFKKHPESLTCDYKDLNSLLLKKKQPPIGGKELKRKNKSKCFETVSN